MFSGDNRKKILCEKSYSVMKSKLVEIVEEVIAFDVSPVAMFPNMLLTPTKGLLLMLRSQGPTQKSMTVMVGKNDNSNRKVFSGFLNLCVQGH